MGIVGSMSDTLSAGRQETSWVWLWAASRSRPFQEEKSHYTNIYWMQTCPNIQCFRSVIFSLTDYTHEWSIFTCSNVTFLIDLLSVAVRKNLDLLLKFLLLSFGLFLQVGLLWAHWQSQSVCVLLKGQSMIINPRWHPLLANTCSALSLLKHLFMLYVFFIYFSKGLRRCLQILQHKK